MIQMFQMIWKMRSVMISIFIISDCQLLEAESYCEEGENCTDDVTANKYIKPQCELDSTELAPYDVITVPYPLDDVILGLPQVQIGGKWDPQDCIAAQSIAIIVPYRRREKDLPVFLATLHPFLQKQRAHYGIYLVHQADEKHFNRGSLLNIGFAEAMREHTYDCIMLHDVDKWPEDTNNLYRCRGGFAIHMIGRQRHVGNQYRDRPYDKYFGGVTAISSKDFSTINGFSNQFWGWGSEDDDLLNRIKHHDLQTSRVDDVIGSYVESYQPYGFVNPRRHEVVKEGMERYSTDGLTDLNYKILGITHEQLYTNISVQLLREDPYPMSYN